MSHNSRPRLALQTCLSLLSVVIVNLRVEDAVAQVAQPNFPITISSSVPNELNSSNGGAPNASPDQAAVFAWQNSSPSTGRRVRSKESLTNARRPLRLATSETPRRNVGSWFGKHCAAKWKSSPATAARSAWCRRQVILVRPEIRPSDTTLFRFITTRRQSPRAIPDRRTIQRPGSISTKPTRLPWTTCTPA